MERRVAGELLVHVSCLGLSHFGVLFCLCSPCVRVYRCSIAQHTSFLSLACFVPHCSHSYTFSRLNFLPLLPPLHPSPPFPSLSSSLHTALVSFLFPCLLSLIPSSVGCKAQSSPSIHYSLVALETKLRLACAVNLFKLSLRRPHSPSSARWPVRENIGVFIKDSLDLCIQAKADGGVGARRLYFIHLFIYYFIHLSSASFLSSKFVQHFPFNVPAWCFVQFSLWLCFAPAS